MLGKLDGQGIADDERKASANEHEVHPEEQRNKGIEEGLGRPNSKAGGAGQEIKEPDQSLAEQPRPRRCRRLELHPERWARNGR